MNRLVILGAGGYGRTVADVARQLGLYQKVCHLDDTPGEGVIGRLDEFARFAGDGTEMIPAFGNNAFRLDWCKKITLNGIALATLVHPSAYVSPTAFLEPGVVVLPMAVVNTNVRMEMGCIVNCHAAIDHGCVIGAGCHICLGAIVKAENRIPALMKVEAGQVIENRTYPL